MVCMDENPTSEEYWREIKELIANHYIANQKLYKALNDTY